MKFTLEQITQIIKEEIAAVLSEDMDLDLEIKSKAEGTEDLTEIMDAVPEEYSPEEVVEEMMRLVGEEELVGMDHDDNLMSKEEALAYLNIYVEFGAYKKALETEDGEKELERIWWEAV